METVSNHPRIEALVRGDESTIRTLYEILLPKIVNYVRNNKGTGDDAEEIFHNALFQLIARAKTRGIQINSSFEAYVFTVCKNLWLKELNKRKKEVRKEGVFELKRNEEDDHIASILDQERWELFEEMISQLSQNCIELLRAYFAKVSYKEIVKKFSYSSENTAFQRVFKCKKRLMDLVKGDPRYLRLCTV